MDGEEQGAPGEGRGQGNRPGQPGSGQPATAPGRSPGQGTQGSGPPSGGGQGPGNTGAADRRQGDPGAMDPTLQYAEQQTDLALEHLEDQLERPDSDLLEQLGWTREEADRFLREWQRLRETAARDDAPGAEARKSLNRALRSLGLRPRGTQLDRGTTPVERLQQSRDTSRSRPPRSWADQFEAYTRGIAEGGD